MSKATIEIVELEPLLCSAKQAAALCGGISVRTWWSLVATGQAPPSIRLNGRRLWRYDLLKFWVRENYPSLDKFMALQKEEVKK